MEPNNKLTVQSRPAESILVGKWPFATKELNGVEVARTYAVFKIDWRFTGTSVGNITTDNTEAYPLANIDHGG